MYRWSLLPRLWLLIVVVARIEAVYDRAYSGIKTKTYHQQSPDEETFDEQHSQHSQHSQQPQYQPYSHYSNSKNYDSPPSYHVSGYGSTSGRLSAAHQQYGHSNGAGSSVSSGTHTYSELPAQQQQSQGGYYHRREPPVYDRRSTQAHTVAQEDPYTGCPPQHTGPVPYAYDCRRFVNCWHGRGHIQSCGPGTVFNPETFECDRPDKVVCSAVGVDDGGNKAKYRTARLLDVSTDRVDALCPHGATGVHPHPTDCVKFLNCANGNVHVQHCAPGTAFSITKLACDHKDMVDCSGRQGRVLEGVPYTSTHADTHEETGNIFCPIGVTGLFPYPFDYTRFINCKKGNTAIQNCMPGTVYSISRGNCDIKANVLHSDHVAYIVSEVSYEYSLTVVSCPPSTDGVHLYPYDPSKYIICNSGHMTIENCAPNTIFCMVRRKCLHKAMVNEQDHVRYYTDIVHNQANIMSQAHSKEILECPHGHGPTSYFPHPFDVNKYLQCANGRLTVEFCTSGTVFSLSKKRCEAKELVAANDKVHSIMEHDERWFTTMNFDYTNHDQGTVHLMCPQNVNGFFLYPFDCTKYLSCHNGDPHVERCANGAVFSISQQKCVSRNAVDAYDRVEYLTETKHEFSSETGQSNNQKLDVNCPYGVTGLYPHPYDCNKYLKCTNGHTYVESCAPGMVFSVSRRYCDYEQSVQEYDRGSYGYKANTHVSANDYAGNVGTYGYGSNGHSNDYGASSSDRIPSQSSGSEVSCPTTAEGMYPHPYDCKKFFTCTNGQTYIKDCGPGTAWSIEMEVCDFEQKVNCTGRWYGGSGFVSRVHNHALSTDSVVCPLVIIGHYLHPFHAHKYISCQRGAMSVESCPQHYVFSISRRVCLPDQLVGAEDRVIYVHKLTTDSTVTASDQHGYVICPSDAKGLYNYPFDGARFIRCDGVHTKIELCQPHSVFSKLQQLCVPETEDVQLETSRWHGGHNQSAGRSITGGSTETAPPTCPAGLTGLSPHPYDCTKYLNCANGIAHVQDCGPGTGFNVKLLVCDFLEKVDCVDGHNLREGKGFGQPGKVVCPAGASGLYPHPHDCTKFLNCANSVTTIQDCGPGTAWSPKLEVCDFIANVDCSDRTSSSFHTVTSDSSTDYSNRGSKSYLHGGVPSNHWDYDAHASASDKHDWRYQQPGRNELVPGNQINTEAHNRGTSTITSTVNEDRWSNMNMRRPVAGGSSTAQSGSGRGYGDHQHTTNYGGASHYNRESSSWSGVGSAVDYQTPTQSVIYEEGSLEPNRNYNSLKTYTAPLAPFSPGITSTATDNRNINRNSSNPTTVLPSTSSTTTTNIYYAQPVGSNEDSEETFDTPSISSTSAGKWIPIPNQNLMPPLPSDKNHAVRNHVNAIEPSQEKSYPPQLPVTHLMPPLAQHPVQPDDDSRELRPNGSAQRPSQSGILSKNFNSYPSSSAIKPPSTHLTPPLPLSTNQKSLDETYVPGTVADASNLYGGMLPPLPVIPSTTPTSYIREDKQFTTTPASFNQPTTIPTYIQPPTPPTSPLQPRPTDTTRLSRVHPSQTYPFLANAAIQNFSRDPHYSPSYSNIAHSRDSVRLNPTANNIQPIKTSYRTPTQASPYPELEDHDQAVDELLIGDALRLMLRPYFNRSGTVPEDTPNTAANHIMKLIPQSPHAPNLAASTSDKITPTTTTTTTFIGAENQAEVELILAGEQHSLTTIPTRNGTRETRTEFYSQNTNERTAGNTNRHGHQHSREFHSRHPNIPNPFATEQDSQVNFNVPDHQHHRQMHHTHHTHSREFHLRHPEIPNPYATTASEDADAAVNTPLPNPQAESTTAFSTHRGIDLRSFNPDCQFDCGNGGCVQSFEVCDGVNNCGNRKDEMQCNHLGYEVRLTGGESSNMGRLEVKILGKWGYVCDDKFGVRDADVVCRELGFSLGASEIRGNSYYPPTEMDISFAMDEVDCRGNETSLRECDFKGWGVSNCGPDEVVGVVCKVAQLKCPNNYWLCSTSKECIPPAFVCDNTPDCADNSDEADDVCNSPVEFRLVGGSTPHEGRLEVRYRGEWGTVCDDDFGVKEAQVLCNSMGLYGKPTIGKTKYGAGSGPIWLDQVSCYGNETSLDKCHHWTWGEHNCNHAEDVGLKCVNGPHSTTSATDVQTQLEDIDGQQQIEDNQRLLEEIGLFSGQWERNSKAIGTQRRCGKFRANLVDEYAHPEERVVNGTVAKRGHHPWQATIRTKGRGGISSHWCGAVLISSKHLLTAAHCLAGYPKGAYFVRMGDHYANIAESSEIDSFIENWYIHEKFRDQTHMNNDIALIVLKTPVKFNDYIQPVCLPERDAQLEENRTCTISGWGSIKSGVSTPSNILRAAQLPILSDAVCKQSHVYGASMTEGMFCAGFMDESVDACDGDSGGPLICHDEDVETLHGIISWGQHCGYANKPGVYVRVEKYVDWILDKINISMHNS